jgi:hypothetical protein
MMTEEHIKEAISLRYIELIAAFNGFKTSSSTPDYGTDLDIKEVDFRIENQHKRYLETGRELKLQLKATTENSVIVEGDFIKYDLNASTYNDLLSRKHSKNPLILILFVLPPDKNNWLNISDNELITKKCAYWFFPESFDSLTPNTDKKRIAICKNNFISNETLNYLFENYS